MQLEECKYTQSPIAGGSDPTCLICLSGSRRRDRCLAGTCSDIAMTLTNDAIRDWIFVHLMATSRSLGLSDLSAILARLHLRRLLYTTSLRTHKDSRSLLDCLPDGSSKQCHGRPREEHSKEGPGCAGQKYEDSPQFEQYSLGRREVLAHTNALAQSIY